MRRALPGRQTARARAGAWGVALTPSSAAVGRAASKHNAGVSEMTTNAWIRIGLLTVVVAAAAGCASVPSQEMSDARRAIRAAEKAAAGEHAPNALARARDALDDARKALARSDYPAAEAAARTARSEAIDARALATEMQLTALSIAEARRAGRPVAGAESFVDRARRAANAGDAERALEYLHRARQLAR